MRTAKLARDLYKYSKNVALTSLLPCDP